MTFNVYTETLSFWEDTFILILMPVKSFTFFILTITKYLGNGDSNC